MESYEKALKEEAEKAREDLIRQRERVLIKKGKKKKTKVTCFECGTYLAKDGEYYFCTKCELYIEPEHLKTQKLLAISVTISDIKKESTENEEFEIEGEWEEGDLWDDNFD